MLFTRARVTRRRLSILRCTTKNAPSVLLLHCRDFISVVSEARELAWLRRGLRAGQRDRGEPDDKANDD